MNTSTLEFFKTVRNVTREALSKAIAINPAVWHPDAENARSLLNVRLAEMFDEQRDAAIAAAKAMLKEIDPSDLSDKMDQALLSGYLSFVTDAEPILESAVLAGMRQASVQFTISDASMISALNTLARDWAKDRAAEMVGMKWVDGILVENPNAAMAISASTREQIRSIITNAFETETPLESIIASLEDAGPFSPQRAEMIARTEVAQAQSAGNYQAWEEVGITQTKWLLSVDHSEPCACEDNENVTRAFGKLYPSGDLMPPAHPNCWCVLVAVGFPE